MPHRAAARQKIESLHEEWELLSTELEREINLGRLVREHLQSIDKFVEKCLTVSQSVDFSSDLLRTISDQAESLRQRIRRKLFHEGTASGIKLDHSELL